MFPGPETLAASEMFIGQMVANGAGKAGNFSLI